MDEAEFTYDPTSENDAEYQGNSHKNEANENHPEDKEIKK